MKTILTIQIALLLITGGTWCLNLYKLVNTDFEPSYKAEIIHGIGIFPPACVVTAWMNFDESQETTQTK